MTPTLDCDNNHVVNLPAVRMVDSRIVDLIPESLATPIQRCDTCNLYSGDEDAAQAVAKATERATLTYEDATTYQWYVTPPLS